MAKSKNDLSAWASDIDLEATRTLIQELQTEGKPWDKLEIGKEKYKANYRRICPKRPEWQNPYQIVPVHYLGPNNRMVVCLKEAGLGDCTACQLRWELHEGGDKAASAGLRASIRTFLNVVKVDQDGELADEKVYLLALNQIQFLGKRGVSYDPDEEAEMPLFYFFEKYGDISHVEHGRDLLIKAKEDKSGDFDTVAMRYAVGEPSPFSGSASLLEEGLIDLPTVVDIVPATEMLSLIEGRATGALVLPAAPTQAQIEAPKATSRFGGAEEEEEPEAPAEEEEEEEEKPAKARRSAPKTDPRDALQRLRSSAAK